MCIVIKEGDAPNSRQGSNLELVLLTSMQASLQQLNTTVETLEGDLRAVKDTVKEVMRAEHISKIKLCMVFQTTHF